MLPGSQPGTLSSLKHALILFKLFSFLWDAVYGTNSEAQKCCVIFIRDATKSADPEHELRAGDPFTNLREKEVKRFGGFENRGFSPH